MRRLVFTAVSFFCRVYQHLEILVLGSPNAAEQRELPDFPHVPSLDRMHCAIPQHHSTGCQHALGVAALSENELFIP